MTHQELFFQENMGVVFTSPKSSVNIFIKFLRNNKKFSRMLFVEGMIFILRSEMFQTVSKVSIDPKLDVNRI